MLKIQDSALKQFLIDKLHEDVFSFVDYIWVEEPASIHEDRIDFNLVVPFDFGKKKLVTLSVMDSGVDVSNPLKYYEDKIFAFQKELTESYVSSVKDKVSEELEKVLDEMRKLLPKDVRLEVISTLYEGARFFVRIRFVHNKNYRTAGLSAFIDDDLYAVHASLLRDGHYAISSIAGWLKRKKLS